MALRARGQARRSTRAFHYRTGDVSRDGHDVLARKGQRRVTTLAEIIGDSAGIRLLREQLEHILKRAATARRPPSILIRGETGTGKGLVARSVHRAGPRARAPFVDINC